MAEAPKRIKRLLREYAAVAHEEELRRALLPVAEAFKRWEREELDSGELSEIIHKFHQGPARDLWVRYNTAHLEMAGAFAVTTGPVGREEMPPELLGHLARAATLFPRRAGGRNSWPPKISLGEPPGPPSPPPAGSRPRAPPS